jgi:diamine N-acetyltransferase
MASPSIRLPRRSSIPTRARVPSMPGSSSSGFLMYDRQETKCKAQETSIYHLIDRKQQGKDYGRAALSKALEEIRAIPWVNRISIFYIPENPVAKPFYTSFGFVEMGRDRDGGVIAVLKQ